MRRFLTIVSSLVLACQGLMASPVDQSQALKLAENFFGKGTTRAQLKLEYKAPYKAATRAGQAEENLFYIFNRGNNQGYIVVAADNRVMPVLAFSDEGTLTEEDIMNHPSIKWLYDEYRNEVKWAIENLPDKPSSEYSRMSSTRAGNYVIEIQPLLQYDNDRRTKLPNAISWGQDQPFNRYAPNYSYGGRRYPTVAGCVATGISTVLRWHKWPLKARGSVSYYWKNQYMSLNFEGNGPENAPYDWSQMPAAVDSRGNDRATGRQVTTTQADNIGRLLRDVAYAVEMDYNPASAGGSGAFVYKAPKVLVNNFGYKKGLSFLERNRYTQAAWLKEVHDEMRDYGPVVYAGFSTGGGHCFVLDGYASNGYVHVDWGWNGSSNGWHLLNVLQPGSEGIGGGYGGYSQHQQMLRYLTPDRDNNPNPNPNPRPEPKPDPKPDPEVQTPALYSVQQYIEKAQQGQDTKFLITLANEGGAAYNGTLRLYVLPTNTDDLSSATLISEGTGRLARSQRVTFSFYTSASSTFKNLPAGKYSMVVGYVVNGEEVPVKLGSNHDSWRIGELTIEGNNDNDEEPNADQDVSPETVRFYQNGNYLGSDYSNISKSSSTFTARFYVKSDNGYTGPVKFYITNTKNGSSSVGSMVDKNIKVNAGGRGYVDVEFPTSSLSRGYYYYVNMRYQKNQGWYYYPSASVPFYVRSYYYGQVGEDGQPTLGPTYVFAVAPNVNDNFQSIGYSAEGGDLDNNTTGINEVQTAKGQFSVAPYVATNDITISTAESGTVSLFSVSGKLVNKTNVKAGDNVLNVANLAPGVYLVNMGNKTQKFVKK